MASAGCSGNYRGGGSGHCVGIVCTLRTVEARCLGKLCCGNMSTRCRWIPVSRHKGRECPGLLPEQDETVVLVQARVTNISKDPLTIFDLVADVKMPGQSTGDQSSAALPEDIDRFMQRFPHLTVHEHGSVDAPHGHSAGRFGGRPDGLCLSLDEGAMDATQERAGNHQLPTWTDPWRCRCSRSKFGPPRNVAGPP